MKNDILDPLDTWSRQIFKNRPLDKPSIDFNQKVMSQVLNLSIKTSKPLISNTLWFIIGSILSIVLILAAQLKTSNLFFGSNFTNKYISKWTIQLFNDWNLSATFTSIILTASIILIAEIIYLKQWHTKKWNTLT